jgi:hypothetical protein
MRSSPNHFIHETGGHRFEIVPLSNGHFVLSIDGQWGGLYRSPEQAVADCFNGHVSTVIKASRPYEVRTGALTFPDSIAGWEINVAQPIEIGAKE